MKPTPPPVILFPPAGTDQNVHQLLQWLQTLLRSIDAYYADQWPRPAPQQTPLNLCEEEDIPF